MATVTPCTRTHLLAMQRRAGLEVPVMPAEEPLPQACTVWVHDEPLCAFGITSPWPGLGLAWFVERDVALSQQYARAIARQVRQWFGQWEHDYRRIEALPLATRADSCRLLTWLGFLRGTAKPLYGPGGETMVEYVRYPQGVPDGG